MFKKNLHIIFLLLLLIDTGYSFRQYLYTELDGDMADIIIPSHWYQKVLDDPFGLEVLLKNEVYCAPNRFFLHWTFSKYFKVVPVLLQNIFNPIDSVYIACAVGKTVIQVFIILLLASYISGKKKIFSKEYLTGAVLVAPFFISYQYWRLGIIDSNVTFAFSYALPVGMLMLFFLPFFKNLFYGKEMNTNIFYRIYLIFFSINSIFKRRIDSGNCNYRLSCCINLSFLS